MRTRLPTSSRTIFLSTHILSDVEARRDRVTILRRAEATTSDELRAKLVGVATPIVRSAAA